MLWSEVNDASQPLSWRGHLNLAFVVRRLPEASIIRLVPIIDFLTLFLNAIDNCFPGGDSGVGSATRFADDRPLLSDVPKGRVTIPLSIGAPLSDVLKVRPIWIMSDVFM